MIQLSSMDGAVIITLCEPYTPSETALLKQAKAVEMQNADTSDNPVGAGGIRWGDCSDKKKHPEKYATVRNSTPQQGDSQIAAQIYDAEMEQLGNALKNAKNDEERDKALVELGWEEILSNTEVPF